MFPAGRNFTTALTLPFVVDLQLIFEKGILKKGF
jgi:hypothetical protein